MITTFLARIGGARLVIGLGILAAVIVLILYMRWDARRDGERAADAKWEQAQRDLAIRSLESQGVATTAATVRAEQYTATVAAEKERIDQALDDGDSALDAMFGVVE